MGRAYKWPAAIFTVAAAELPVVMSATVTGKLSRVTQAQALDLDHVIIQN
jgi:hypothetical protein